MASVTPSHSLVPFKSLSSDGIADASILVDFSLLDAYPAQVRAIRDAAVLLRQLLEVTPEAISRLVLRVQTSGTPALVTCLASQLLAEGATTIVLLFHITDSLEPSLQLTSLRLLRRLVDQLNPELFVSLFDSYPDESRAIRVACNELLRTTLFRQQRDVSLPLLSNGEVSPDASDTETRVEACRVLLDLLVAHGSVQFPSVVSTLLGLPQSFSAARIPSSVSCILATLLTFLDSPALLSLHAVMGAKVVRFLCLLCGHRDVGNRRSSHP